VGVEGEVVEAVAEEAASVAGEDRGEGEGELGKLVGEEGETGLGGVLLETLLVCLEFKLEFLLCLQISASFFLILDFLLILLQFLLDLFDFLLRLQSILLNFEFSFPNLLNINYRSSRFVLRNS